MFTKLRLLPFVSFAILALAACDSSEPTSSDDHDAAQNAQALDVAALRGDTLVLAQRSTFPGAPLLRVEGSPLPSEITLALHGDFRFADGSDHARAKVDSEGWVHVPPFTAPTSAAEGQLVVDDLALPHAPAVDLVAAAPEDFARVQASDYARDAVESGDGYLVLDRSTVAEDSQGQLQSTTCTGDAADPNYALCVCVFVGNVGKLTIDSSCRGRLPIWVIPENGSAAAFTPPNAGITYEADGFKVGGQIYKIDGSTCNTIRCTSTQWWVDSCINNLAALMGKKAPYPVGPGTFGNEPPAGAPAAVVP